MNFFGRIFNRVSQTLSIIPSYLANIAWALQNVFSALVREGYRSNAVVYACLKLKSEAVPEPPLKIYVDSGNGEEEDPEHPLRKLIARPNPLQTEFEFWELTTLHIDIAGRATWWKQRSNNGDILHLWPLRPDRITPIYAKGMPPLWGWQYNLDGELVNIPYTEVLSFNYPRPDDPTGGIVDGLGPLEVLRREVDSDNAQTRLVYAFSKNYAMPSVIITAKGVYDEAKAKRLKEQFMRLYGGEKFGEPGILDSESKIEKLSFNLRDLQFGDLRAETVTRICAAFGVPPILVGVSGIL